MGATLATPVSPHCRIGRNKNTTKLMRDCSYQSNEANAGAPIVKGYCTLEWGGLKAWGGLIHAAKHIGWLRKKDKQGQASLLIAAPAGGFRPQAKVI